MKTIREDGVLTLLEKIVLEENEEILVEKAKDAKREHERIV